MGAGGYKGQTWDSLDSKIRISARGLTAAVLGSGFRGHRIPVDSADTLLSEIIGNGMDAGVIVCWKLCQRVPINAKE